MSPAIKQLRAECSLKERLLVDEVLRLVADDLQKAESEREATRKREHWIDYMLNGVTNYVERCDRHERSFIGREIEHLKQTYEQQH